ncbi:MAG: hypothetical protein AB7I30_12710 [Isosphaeraceae bacterium]
MKTSRDRQSAFNAASRGHWDAFAPHRAQISALLRLNERSDRTARLCVLGAGNLNDFDVAATLLVYREVHLVDLDAEALALAVARRGVSDRPGLFRHGGVDLTGMLDAMASWGPLTPVHPPDLQALADWPARRVAPTLPGPFDRVVSTCLLSQLIANARHSVGESHSAFPSIVQAIRLGHLRLLVELTAPGGEALLVTDATSTDLVPGLASWPDESLGRRLVQIAREGRLFHGADPTAIRSLFHDDPELATRVDRVEAVPPWKWRLHDRDYLVWALRLSRGSRLF